jgi:hypothetical protein
MTDLSPDASNDSIRNIVSQMQAELDTLVQEKIVLARRARNLRKFLGKRFKATDGIKPRTPSPRCTNAPKPKTSSARDLVYDSLKRACRIALLEADGRATPAQLYKLIMQRSSFIFDGDKEEHLNMIVQVLCLMSDTREIVCVTSDPYSHWAVIQSDNCVQAR